MFYEGVLRGLAEKWNSDLYILPESTHECYAVPAGQHDLQYLHATVSEANTKVVRPEEGLSNNVYLYSKAGDKLMIASYEGSDNTAN